MKEQLPGVKEVMPMGQATFANRLIRIVTRFDLSAGDEPLGLPVLEALLQEAHNLSLPFQIGCRRRPVTLFARFRVHPADEIEALLKDIIWFWNEIFVFP